MRKILIIGKNSLLCKLFLENTSIKNFQIYSRNEIKKINFNNFTHVINFSFHPLLFTTKYKKKYDLDLKLLRIARMHSFIYVMISSRHVYSSSQKIINEKNKVYKPSTFYGKNKIIIERNIKKIIPKKYLILRLGTLLFNKASLKKCLFSSILLNNLKKNKKIIFNFNDKVYKDFITPKYFTESIDKLISSNSYGTYNISSGLKINVKKIAKKIIQGYGEGSITMYNNNNKNDSFVMSNKKLIKKISISISKNQIMNYAFNMGKSLKNE
jgi:dTDP-4-dehydrorhamnose reductase